MTQLDNIITNIEVLEESTLLGIAKEDAIYFEQCSIKPEEAE